MWHIDIPICRCIAILIYVTIFIYNPRLSSFTIQKNIVNLSTYSNVLYEKKADINIENTRNKQIKQIQIQMHIFHLKMKAPKKDSKKLHCKMRKYEHVTNKQFERNLKNMQIWLVGWNSVKSIQILMRKRNKEKLTEIFEGINSISDQVYAQNIAEENI